MGRASSGTWTVYESKRLELSGLLKQRFIKKGHQIATRLSWTDNRGANTGSILMFSSYTDELDGKYIELSYAHFDRDGNKSNHKYRIRLLEQPSNLGKGKILYFICPKTFVRCRILYMAYGSPIFKARVAYRPRLYYDCQRASKLSRYNDSFWRIDSHLGKLLARARQGKRTFKGRLTKAARRYTRLYSKQCVMEELRWTLGAPKSIRTMGNNS